MKLCVFQGTFNPIHNAHLRVGEFVFEKYRPDKFLFIPAANPPHKMSDPSYAIHRYKMVELALSDKKNFVVSDIEYKRDGKSYTYDTICELRKVYNTNERIMFVIGTDAFEKIEAWYEYEKLKKLVKFIVFARENTFEPSRFDYLKSQGVVFEIQSLSFEDISSTTLRDMIMQDDNICDLVPENVEEYIKENGLYKN